MGVNPPRSSTPYHFPRCPSLSPSLFPFPVFLTLLSSCSFLSPPCSISADYGVYGSVVSSPGRVRGSWLETNFVHLDSWGL